LALNKRKVLDAARKHAQKGAKQKALKEYDKLLAADPRDAKLMLEIGDAYRRWGQVEEAISQYTKVASQFRQDGFDARAVAVYKQILNLDSKRFETYVQLGDLYQHMGLDAEAIGSLQTAADGYHKEGNKPKALELLRKMAALDPSNTTSRMKVADLLKQEGMDADAVSEYGEVADELKRQGATDSVPPVLERILEIEPDSKATLQKLTECYIELNRPDRAEPFAVRLVECDADADHLESLCTIYRSLNDEEKLAAATRALAKLYRDRGDEDQAREIMQRLPAESVVENGGLGKDQSEMEEPSLSDDDLLDDDEFLLGDDNDEGPLDLGAGAGSPEPQPAPALTPEPPAVDPNEVSQQSIEVPDGDPDQLFAEASVYLRYGKVDQAIASLKGILLQDPDHRGALEKLGEAAAEQGDDAGAVANWRRAAEIAAEQGDASGLDLLRDRVRALDADAAAALPSIETAPAPGDDAGPDLGGTDDIDIDIDLDVEPAAPEVAAADDGDAGGIDLDLEDGADGIEISLDDESDDGGVEAEVDDGFEIDIDADADLQAALADASADEPKADTDDDVVGADASEFEIDLSADVGDGIDLESDDDGGFDLADADAGLEFDDDDAVAAEAASDVDSAELDIDVDEDDGLDVGAGTAATEGGVSVPDTDAGDLSMSSAAQIKEQLEEAEFYLQQDLHDEAEALYRRVLAVAPGHPSALLRLGEISAARGASPAVSDEPVGADLGDGSLVEEAALDIGLEDELQEGLEDETDAAIALPGDPAADGDGAFSDETEDSTEVAMLDAAAAGVAEAPSSPLLAEDIADAALANEAGIEETQPIEPTAVEPEPIVAAADDGDSFDLAAELAGAFEEANAPDAADEAENSETQSVLSKVDDGFESIFSDFKKGVSASLEEGDFETRYDLGIAYREMGLYEDAIAEFRVCLDSANRRLESLHIMGLCALDLGRPADAVNHLEQALATVDLAEDRKIGIYFDLGRCHEAAGDPARAEGVYLEVKSLDAKFPGIDERLESARSGGGAAPIELADDEGGLENFDDLFSDEGADEASGESFESFDDVITSAEADGLTEAEPIDDDDDVATAELEIPADVDDDPATDSGTSGRRKKKISFV